MSKPDIARAALQAKYPLTGDYMVEVRRLCQRGIEEGWLSVDAMANLRSLRLAPQAKHFPFAIEALHLRGTGGGHGHPKGEISVSWPVAGTPRLCGAGPGWQVMPPGSKHVPEVVGGTMFILHFLPDGQIDWDANANANAKASQPRGSAMLANAPRSPAAAPPARASRRASARG